MPNDPTPRCPRCNSTQVELYESRPRYADSDYLHERQPIGATLAYKCPCGMAFTRELHVPPETTAKG